VKSREILVAFAADDSGPLGNIWRLTAKKTDFYLGPMGQAEAFHLSAHGPNSTHPGHRFHVKVDPKAAAAIEQQGDFIIHGIPRKGYPLHGLELAPGAYLVARIRWLWDLQRARFRQAATSATPLPEISDGQFGARLAKPLQPNDAADLDLVVSYGEPYWPHGDHSLRDNSRLGPLRNDAGMCLTATSFQRSQVAFPSPMGLVPPLPRSGEEPNRLLGGGPGDDDRMYWFVEAITSRQVIEASRPKL
jgi:hypothetical protein